MISNPPSPKQLVQQLDWDPSDVAHDCELAAEDFLEGGLQFMNLFLGASAISTVVWASIATCFVAYAVYRFFERLFVILVFIGIILTVINPWSYSSSSYGKSNQFNEKTTNRTVNYNYTLQ